MNDFRYKCLFRRLHGFASDRSLADRRLIRRYYFPLSTEKLPLFPNSGDFYYRGAIWGEGGANRFSYLYYIGSWQRRDTSARTKTLDASWLKARLCPKRCRCKAGTIRWMPMNEGGKVEYEYSELSTDSPSSEMRNTGTPQKYWVLSKSIEGS